MNTIKRKVLDIPVSAIKNVDDIFYRQIGMDKDKAIQKFEKRINATKNLVYENISIKSVYESYPIKYIEKECICLEDNSIIESKILAEVLKSSEELILNVVSVTGYDEIEDQTTDNLDIMFVDGWGTAIADCSSVWLKESIKEELSQKELFITYSWSPGQHGVDIKLQQLLFEKLIPEEIGVTLSKSYMMHPKKSISGIIGISKNEDAATIRACDYCEHRETCPSAYV